jgi:hypothetical protein
VSKIDVTQPNRVDQAGRGDAVRCVPRPHQRQRTAVRCADQVDAVESEPVDDGVEPRHVVVDRRDRAALHAEADIAHQVDGVHGAIRTS